MVNQVVILHLLTVSLKHYTSQLPVSRIQFEVTAANCLLGDKAGVNNIHESMDLIIKIMWIANFNLKYNRFADPGNRTDYGFIQEFWLGLHILNHFT